MKRFFNRLFNKQTEYEVITKVEHLDSILRTIFRDKTVSYERMDLTYLEGNRVVVEIRSTYKDIKSMIKTLLERISKVDLYNVEIYEIDGKVDLINKKRRAI